MLLEGAQAVVQREVELLQKAMQEFADAPRGLMQEGDPQAHAKAPRAGQTSFEGALRNMRELAEMAGRANREALEMISQRALEKLRYSPHCHGPEARERRREAGTPRLRS